MLGDDQIKSKAPDIGEPCFFMDFIDLPVFLNTDQARVLAN